MRLVLFSAGFALEELFGYLGLGCGLRRCLDISLGMRLGFLVS